MEVVHFKSSLKSAWDFVLENSINGLFLFRREFLEYHKGRFQDASVLILDKGQPVAILPCNVFENCLFSHQGLNVGGIVLKQGLSQSKISDIIESLFQYWVENRLSVIEIKCIPDLYCLSSQDFLVENLMKRGFVSRYTTDTYIIDSLNLQKLRTGRWKLRTSQRRNFLIREEEDLSEFWNQVLAPLYLDKIGVPPTHSLQEIHELKAKNYSFISQFVICNSDGEILAGITVFEYERVAKFQYIATTKEGKKLRALDSLMEYLIQEKFTQKRYIDLGTANNPISGIAVKGLIDWKLSWHAKPYPLYKLRNESVN